jgi:hypothetical protein
MSQRKTKRLRRQIRKEKTPIIQNAILEIKTWNLKERIKFAWYIIKGVKK